MTRQRIKIGRPEVITEGDKSVLRAVIDDAGENKVLTFKVDKEFGPYLTYERSDAFVAGVLYYAMVKDRDIEWETPCNEQLIYQLETFFIPIYEDNIAFMHGIKLIGPTTRELLPCENGVATGFSSGVDSSYTIHKYLSSRYPEYRLTHLIYTDWMLTSFGKEYGDAYLNRYLSVLPECANELGLKLIYVNFRPDEQFSIGYVQDKVNGLVSDAGLYAFKYCAPAIALQKLIKIFYFSNAYLPSEFTFHKDDMCFHDLFTLPMMTTDAQKFYSSGSETHRINKVEDIADWAYAQRHLQVCGISNENDQNCGHCNKCIRTMSELYAIGKLDQFKDRFPIDDYKKHLARRLAMVMMEAHNGYSHSVDLLNKCRENGKRIPVMSYVLCPGYIVLEFMRVHLRTKGWARKIYWKLHFDRLFYGRSMKEISYSMDESFLNEK